MQIAIDVKCICHEHFMKEPIDCRNYYEADCLLNWE